MILTMAATVYDVLNQLREQSTSEAQKGALFEQLMVAYLKADPTYADQFSDVFLWQNWPGRNGKSDTGIDLVAIDRLTGENVAIQCKFYAQGHRVSKKDIDTFLSASGTHDFGQRIIVSTDGATWGPNAETALQNQQIPVRRINMSDLAASNIDWEQFSWSTPQVVQTTGKKTVRPHQRTAIDKVTAGLGESDRGKLIMACGTGKTFTSLRLAEENVGAGGAVLFLLPSISLLSQTVREWATEAQVPLRMLAVCSDAKSTKKTGNTEDISAVDIALPATTNPALLQERWASAAHDPDAMTVVFSTYQSIDVVAQAQAAGGFPPFDLIVCDEAHRTTGVTLAGADESAFVRVHDNDFLQGTKRLYMTATPRIFGEESKKKATVKDAVIASMDDEEVYGTELHRLGFGEAVEKNLLTDYRVLILTVDEKYVSGNFQTELAEDGEIQLSDAAKIIGCWNGLAKHFDTMPGEPLAPMQRAVAFAPNIATSKAIAAAFPTIVDKHVKKLDAPSFVDPTDQPDTSHRSGDLVVECDHVDGTFNALERNKRLDWLKADVPDGTCRVLTNARCLSEGVDVPALDSVMFLTPRGSEVDVVQSVGRVMRKAPGKEYGYIILPVAVPAGSSPDQALADNKRYAVVWQVLNALRSHDDRFDATVNKIDLNKKKSTVRIGFGGINEDGELSTGGWEQVGLDLTWGEGWREAIYARIVDKVGNRKYWATWAGDVATIAHQVTERIQGILADQSSTVATEFDAFLQGLRGSLNENITAADAVEMLAQHLITRPIFQALFGAYDFTDSNPVAQIMERMLTALDEHNLDTETASLDKFYDSVALRLDDIDNTEGRQRILVELYDNFFAKAFKRRVEKNGIVYTPIEIVDFILRSADELSRQHFDQGLTDEGVHILDGFTGTGTFIVRLLQLGLIEPKDLVRKYRHEIHANELLLLAYYIAAVNIESAFLDAKREAGLERRPQYESFPGLVLTDTFQSYEPGDRLDDAVFIGNNKRLTRQKANPITVIVGNPPYSVGQDSANDNNANDNYPGLDASIRDTYAAKSTATNKNSLYDSYIRAIRWATLRLADRGVIAFVANGGWIDANTADGMRLTLADEFSDIHIYNLRGNQRTAGEQSRKEGGKVFGAGSRATVAITILVRDPARTGPGGVHYTDIGDYLSRDQKLELVATAGSVTSLKPVTIAPNEHGDWLNQRREDFDGFMPVGEKGSTTAVFDRWGPGLQTNRDAWVYNASRATIEDSMQRASKSYSAALAGYRTNDGAAIKWSSSLEQRLAAREVVGYRDESTRRARYRPFESAHVYFDRPWLHRPGITPSAFPTVTHPNHGYYALNPGADKPFAVLAVDQIPDLALYGSNAGQFFARWRYEKVDADDGTQSFATFDDSGELIDGYRRIDNITDAALSKFVAAYGDSITKDDVFHYVYGLLHSPDYRDTYAADLKKMLPRIPLITDPQPYITAGEQLMKLHLGYEQVEPYPLDGIEPDAPEGDLAYDFYAVQKMRFAKLPKEPGERSAKDDSSTIIYNPRITVSGIPDEAYRYMLGSRTAIEWIMDRYQVKTDKPSGIVNDPNDWSREVEDPRYILDLLARIVTVSLETMMIVDSLPPITVRKDQ